MQPTSTLLNDDDHTPSISPLQPIPASMPNEHVVELSPWTTQGSKIFLDICSGSNKPLTAALSALCVPCLAIGKFFDQRMDMFHDPFFEQLLRLCGAGSLAIQQHLHHVLSIAC